jgi:hypothetical protein
MLVFEPSNNPETLKFPDFKVAQQKWSVERVSKWALGDTTTVMYTKEN